MIETTEHIDELRLQQLARMAKCRKSVSQPDVDASWQKFRSEHIDVRKQNRSRSLRMWASALAGAAAMFIGFVVYINFFSDSEKLVALQYDETPQQITLTDGGVMSDLSSKDSISFLVSDKHKTSTVTSSNVRNAKEEKLQCLSTPRGMDFKITLQDGTEVWLNAESSIEFPSAFHGTERKVNLKGEAYFKVAHNASMPFIVNLGDKTVHVLGTEFDVRNYASEQSSVVLVKGSVLLCDEHGKEEATLIPGQGATWTEGNNVNVHEVDTYGTTQWIDGLFYFEEHSLGVVLREVGRWYNYGVVFKNDKHINYKIHFSASRNDGVESIIDDLNTLCGFKLTIENKNIVVY